MKGDGFSMDGGYILLGDEDIEELIQEDEVYLDWTKCNRTFREAVES
jgi:hypothetical protein